MLFEPVVTNGAAILTMIVLWSVLAAIGTYMYMDFKRRDLQEKVDVLDWYAYYSDRELDEMMEEMNLLRQEVDGKDDYIRHLISKFDSENAPVVYRVAEDGAITREVE